MIDEPRYPAIQASWRRCVEDYHLDPEAQARLEVFTRAELRRSREQMEQLLALGSSAIERLLHIADEAGYCVLVADPGGVVVENCTMSKVGRALADEGLAMGSLWDERMVGTNGIGTCIANGSAITVCGAEHFSPSFRQFTCSSAPIYGPDGTIVGILDVSSHPRGDRAGERLALHLVQETANRIEAAMFAKRFENRHVVSLSRARDLLDPDMRALVAMDETGSILGATQNLQDFFERLDRPCLDGRHIEELLPDSLERLLAKPGEPFLLPVSGGEPIYVTVTAPARPASVRGVRYSGGRRRTGAPPVLSLAQIVGSDPRMRRNATACARLFERNVSILLSGETGVGKEAFAKALHDRSARRDKPFVAVNCAAIPESLIESELFGYAPGTFTGALKEGKHGKILASNGGTLFLDEIGDMPLDLQARLLRVLAEREITPLGAVKPLPVDINVICATHLDLAELVREGRFRQDLYYRIHGAKIVLPPLRERTDTAEIIRRIVADETAPEEELGFAPEAWKLLMSYDWPGNIRELKNVIRYAVCMRNGSMIRGADLPEELRAPPLSPCSADRTVTPPRRLVSLSDRGDEPAGDKARLLQALRHRRWCVSQAARDLGISRATLHRKIRDHGIVRPDHRDVPDDRSRIPDQT